MMLCKFQEKRRQNIVNTHNVTLAHHRVPSNSVVEHPTRPRRVVGSNPIWDSDYFRVYVYPRIYIITLLLT